MMSRNYLWLLVFFILPVTITAQQVTVTDVAGRKVTLKKHARKVLLGEGRDIVTLNILHNNPAELVAAWQGDFKKTLEYGHYVKKFPELARLPVVGQNAETFSVEMAIASRPDVAIFSIKGHGPGPENKNVITQLTAAGIPVVFIDFRENPFKNTIPSIRLLGQVLHLENKATAFINFYTTRLNRIKNTIAAKKPAAPKVFMDMKAGMNENEFNSPGKGNLTQYIQLAGGINIAEKIIPGAVGQLNQEYVISQKPDVYIATGTDIFRGKGVVMGADVTKEEAEASINKRLKNPVIASLPAIKNKRAYGLWHLFYASPFNIIAAECIAKWLHPTLFKDVNPQATLNELNTKFLSVPMTGTYWIDL